MLPPKSATQPQLVQARPAAPEQPAAKKGRITSVIARGAHLTGNLKFNEDVKIEGHVTGDVMVEGEFLLSIAEAAAIKGNVTATNVTVSGRITGSVSCKMLVIDNTGVIHGDVAYEQLKVAEGAELNGNMVRAKPGQGVSLRVARGGKWEPLRLVKFSTVTLLVVAVLGVGGVMARGIAHEFNSAKSEARTTSSTDEQTADKLASAQRAPR